MSGCADVCLSHDYDGSMEFYSETLVRRSRKEHKCCECYAVVPVGASYMKASGKCDGDVFSEATCTDCHEIRKAFVCGSWVFGQLWESMCEEMFPVWRTKGAWDCLAKLTSESAVAKCNAQFREWMEVNEYDEPEGA